MTSQNWSEADANREEHARPTPAAERAYANGQLSARRARQAVFEQQLNQASRPDAAG